MSVQGSTKPTAPEPQTGAASETYASREWRWESLADLAAEGVPILYGILQPGPDTPGGVPYVRPTEIVEDAIDLPSVRRTTPTIANKYKRSLLKPNDVILSIVGTIGKVALVPTALDGGNITQSSVRFRPRADKVSSRYIAWALRSPILRKQFDKHRLGTAVPRLNVAHVRSLQVPVPPLPEQERIVAEIEKQFTRLDAGVAFLRRVQANLKRYRAAVLKAACEGRLVPTAGGFEHVPLRGLIGAVGQGWSPKCDTARALLPDEWAVITTTAIQSMRYRDAEAKPLPAQFAPRPQLEIQPGDFLMTRKGPRKRAGVSCLVRHTRPRLMVCDTVYRFRCDASRVLPPFLEVALNSPSTVEAIDRQKAGINESGVSLTHEKLGAVIIPVPSLADQERIVAEVERRLSVVDELDATVTANFQRATRLREAVLHRAFSEGLA